jgi:ubiquinone/menaquinone biosynthesis C-methylase UbiE
MGYQQINIGGFFHSGKDRTKDYYQIFPKKPTDLTILDIGCHNGFYILKAISEGAKYAMGLEKQGGFLKVGNKAKDYLGYKNISFIEMDVLNGLPDASFDVIICLNILHYFSIEQIKSLLKEIDEKTKKMMIFEILSCDDSNYTMKIKRRTMVNALSVLFFKNHFPDYNIEVMDSIVTKGRKILKVKKMEGIMGGKE